MTLQIENAGPAGREAGGLGRQRSAGALLDARPAEQTDADQGADDAEGLRDGDGDLPEAVLAGGRVDRRGGVVGGAHATSSEVVTVTVSDGSSGRRPRPSEALAPSPMTRKPAATRADSRVASV